jgi:hypothetical protein
MSALTSFTRFGKLPAELRQQIWAVALSAPHILTVDDKTGLGFLGTSPGAIDLACREAREVAVRTRRTDGNFFHGTDLDTTVLYIGADEASYQMSLLREQQVPIKHVAYWWAWQMDVEGQPDDAFNRLRLDCDVNETLRTVIVRLSRPFGAEKPLTAAEAAFYATLPAHTGHGLDVDPWQYRSKRQQVLGAFHRYWGSRPEVQLHIVEAHY